MLGCDGGWGPDWRGLKHKGQVRIQSGQTIPFSNDWKGREEMWRAGGGKVTRVGGKLRKEGKNVLGKMKGPGARGCLKDEKDSDWG